MTSERLRHYQKSIFTSAIRSENSHTELLRNFLEYSPELLRAFVTFLTGSDTHALPSGIRTQVPSGTDGTPDLVLDFSEGSTPRINVEIKAKVNCPPTSLQMADGTHPGHHRTGDMYFLVPRCWMYGNKVRRPVRSWQNLANRLRYLPCQKMDKWLPDYCKFLDLEFPSVYLYKEECEMLKSNRPALVVSLARKLHRTIDALGKTFESEGYKLNWRSNSDSEYYGFFLLDKNSRDYKLWVGMWSEHGLLLGAGYENHWHPTPPEGFEEMRQTHWRILSLNDIYEQEGEDTVEAAFNRLSPIVERMSIAH